MSNVVDYFEIGSPDPDAARAFYGELFDWTIGPQAEPAQYSIIEEDRGGLWGTSAIGGTITVSGPAANPKALMGTAELNQLDVKFGKTLRYRTTRIQPQLGIFNVTNEATVLSQNNSFGPTLDRVQSILDGRVVRLSVQIDF